MNPTTHPCYLNGQFTPLAEAKVSVMDRGFLFGDGVYEAVPVYGTRLFRVADHLTRLEHSLQQLRLPNPFEREQWLALMTRMVAQTVEATGAQDQLLYLQVTRGAAPERYIVPPPDLDPTVFMMSQPHTPPSAAQRHHGVAAVTARDLRWSRGNIKSISLLGNVLARQAATDQNAVETIMVHDGWLTEGASSNVWVVFEDALLTPPPGEHVLEGVRLKLIRELCEEEGIPCNIRPVPEGELSAASEVILSSAGREVLPVTTLDGEPVGHGALRGKPGPVFAKLFEAYQRAKLRD